MCLNFATLPGWAGVVQLPFEFAGVPTVLRVVFLLGRFFRFPLPHGRL